MPLAAFPKCFIRAILQDRTMTIRDFVDLASGIGLDGVELYSPMLAGWDDSRLHALKTCADDRNIKLAMMCHSPDFTQPEAAARRAEVLREAEVIRQTALLGGRYCRVLSGQDRAELRIADGIRFAVDCIMALLPIAETYGVTLTLENHFKDDLWERPEFTRRADRFVELVNAIPETPWFGVNFDPSNATVNGDDPLALLQTVKRRVVTMHASDRYLPNGELPGSDIEYAMLRHGVIGQGLNDYDAIFGILRSVDFQGWVSIEDGVDPSRGVEDLRASARFLRQKMAEYGIA